MKQPLSRHLNNDELLDRLYGLGELGVAHLRECQECSSRFQALERRRAEVAAASSRASEAASNRLLMVQRRAIYSKLGRAPAARLHWAPAALAAAFLLVTGVFLARPHAVRPPDAASGVELREEQLFSDLNSMEQSDEPRAAAPLHALFEASAGDVYQ